uniref:Uncharacterized protein n=1 Tax=Cannabis sativa TaxID=3483 RepID=A0A803PNY1_CANSA
MPIRDRSPGLRPMSVQCPGLGYEFGIRGLGLGSGWGPGPRSGSCGRSPGPRTEFEAEVWVRVWGQD